MSRFPLLDIGRDVSVAVGAYIGIARDQFWSWLANDGYSIRLAEAVKRFEAEDRLNGYEAENDGLDGDCGLGDLSEPDESVFRSGGQMKEYGPRPRIATASPRYSKDCQCTWHFEGEECRCPSCTDVLRAEEETSPAKAAQGTPGSGASEPPDAPAPGHSTWVIPVKDGVPYEDHYPYTPSLSEADVRRIVRDEMSAYNTVVGDFFTRVGDNAAVALNNESSK